MLKPARTLHRAFLFAPIAEHAIPPKVLDFKQAILQDHFLSSLFIVKDRLLQGLPSTLCAVTILANPIAKLAITLEPVAATATAASARYLSGACDTTAL